MLRLIVNADDLGLTAGVNRAIFEAHARGIVTSATLMANAPAFEDAVAQLRAIPAEATGKLGIGCHLVLADGAPVSPPDAVRSLLDPAQRVPIFRKRLWEFAKAALWGAISAEEVETEATAQIRKIQQAGIEVAHVDCHKHTHMFPVVLKGVLRAARATGITAIRNLFEPGFARRAQKRRDRVRAAEVAVLKMLFASKFRGQVEKFGLVTTDGSLAVTATGTLDAETLTTIVARLPRDGTYEIVCHPGYNDAELAAAGTRLLRSREIELEMLCSTGVRDALRAAQVELINFRQLASLAESNPNVIHPMR